MQHKFAILALQSQGNPFRDHECQDGQRDHQDAEHEGEVVDGQPEQGRHDVVGALQHQHHVERDERDAESGARGGVARAVEHVLLAAVAGGPALDPRVQGQHAEEKPWQDDGRDEDVERQREAADHELEHAGHDAQSAVDEQHVPVGLGSRGDGGRVVRPVVPHRVDLEHRCEQRDHTKHHEEEPTRLGRVHGEQRKAHHVLVSATAARVLGVLVQEDQEQVQRDEPQNQGGDQQNMRGEHPRNECFTRELPAEEAVGDVGAEDWD